MAPLVIAGSLWGWFQGHSLSAHPTMPLMVVHDLQLMQLKSAAPVLLK